MSSFYEKRQARIERLLSRAEKQEKIAAQNCISKIYGEENSGIPLGQPILVGHHSERRHRKQLERMENRARKGFEAANYAEGLKQRAYAAENNNAILSDDPEAREKILKKIANLESSIEWMKTVNKKLKTYKTLANAIDQLQKEEPTKETVTLLKHLIQSEKFYAFPPENITRHLFSTTSARAEIRRLKDRLATLEVQSTRTDYQINGVDVLFRDGQVQVHFGFKPSEEIRTKLKRSPLALKWSRYSEAWVRKQTAGVGNYFFQELNKVLNEVQP